MPGCREAARLHALAGRGCCEHPRSLLERGAALRRVRRRGCAPQVAHVLLEGLRLEVRGGGGGGVAARLALAGLQVDNQLAAAARAVVLAAAAQARALAAAYLGWSLRACTVGSDTE